MPERYNIAADVCDKHDPDKLAMIHVHFGGAVREVRWGELQAASNRFARVLREHGVEKGDRVAMLLPPTPETAAAFFAVFKCGAILLSMSVLYGDDGIRHRVSDSAAKVLVTDAANAGRVDPALVEHILLIEDLPAGGDDALRRPRTRWPTTRRSSTTPRARPASPRGSCTRTATCSRTRSSSTATRCEEGELFHGMGEWAWAAGIAPLFGPWRLGAVQLVYQREGGFDPHKQLAVLSEHGATNVFTTPTAMRSMMGIGDAGTRYPQRFRRVCSAGEPLNPEAIRWFREQFGITVLDYYGLTESYPLVANYPFLEVREGSMGKPMPGWDIQILDEDERPVPAGERGEICMRARSNPHYPLGYWRQDEETEETFGGEWFHTKDAARFDEDGYVWYEGRADDVIIAAGYRIGPFEVESTCLEHPAVAEAAAVASPTSGAATWSRRSSCSRPGSEPSDALADEIKAYVRGHLGAHAYPRKVEFVDSLPKTLTGKIRRIELRQAGARRSRRVR